MNVLIKNKKSQLEKFLHLHLHKYKVYRLLVCVFLRTFSAGERRPLLCHRVFPRSTFTPGTPTVTRREVRVTVSQGHLYFFRGLSNS